VLHHHVHGKAQVSKVRDVHAACHPRLAQITRTRSTQSRDSDLRVALAPNSAFTSRTGRVKSVLLCDDPAQNILMAANSNSTPSWHSNRICATTATGLWTTAQGRKKIAAAGWANSQLGQWAQTTVPGALIVWRRSCWRGRFQVVSGSGDVRGAQPTEGPGPGTLGELA
jgi:hypothetical protein